MSFNSSVQQIGTSIASFLSGLIVIQATDSKLLRYDWVGYVSVFVLIGSLMLARWLFKGLDEEVAVSEASLVKKIVTS